VLSTAASMENRSNLAGCIKFHKITVFTIDAAERLRYYLMCSVKKAVRWTIRMHISWMEVLNKYLGILPTIKNSPLAVATTEMGNVPFTEATHESIILSPPPVAWKNQYNLTLKTVPESPCAMLQNLKNIEKLFVEKYNEKSQATKAEAATAPKTAEHVPKKHVHGGGSDRGTPQKGHSAKYCKWCKNANGPYTTHNTIKCHRFEKDSMPKDKPVKPLDSTKKPWKKSGSRDSSQRAYLTEKAAKIKKKLKKTKNHGKKSACDSSDSDSNSDWDSWSGSTGSQVDKRLKLEQPTGIDLKSTDTCPIKATKLALDTIRANEIAIENSETGKVTAALAILKIFGDKSNSRNSKLLIKPNKWLNSKKKDLNQSNKHLNGLSEPVSNVSKRQIVKKKL
jgi:hypothetical protein